MSKTVAADLARRYEDALQDGVRIRIHGGWTRKKRQGILGSQLAISRSQSGIPIRFAMIRVSMISGGVWV